MRQPTLKSFILIIALILLVSLACRSSGQADPIATVELVVEPEPVVVAAEPEPVPTNTAESVLPPTEEDVIEQDEQEDNESNQEQSALVALEFYNEEFGFDPYWSYLVVSPRGSDPKSASYYFERGRMIFDITERELYAYYINKQHSYENVKLDIYLENRGVNSQQVSLVCQMSNEGWYEWAVQSDGLWRLYFVSDDGNFVDYDIIARGGSKYVRIGKAVNEYTLICEGNKLSFFINGVEPTGSPHIDRKYALRWGEVGFSVSSLQVTPVNVEIDWFSVSTP